MKNMGGPPNHDQGRRQSLRSIAAPQIYTLSSSANTDAQNPISPSTTNWELAGKLNPYLLIACVLDGD